MEGKREKEENPMEANNYKEWKREIKTKIQKVIEPLFCDIREICYND